MGTDGDAAAQEPGRRERLLGLLLAMAMFVLVVDTSLMNVSISAVVRDLGTTVSGVQSAIALEALVSAAFILIGGKVGDLIGRKRAYLVGLLGYAVGATAMTLAQSLTAVVVFWAVVGGLGASLLLPAMQSLIHGNFEGAARRKVYALVGAAAAIAAAVGPLLGGFITTYLSWRVGFALEVVIIIVVLVGAKLVRDVPYTGPRGVDVVGAALSVVGMGGLVLGILVWQEGGERVGLVLAIGVAGMLGLMLWLRRRARRAEPALLDPGLFSSAHFRVGVSQQMLQQVALGGTMIVLPIFLQMVLEYDAMGAGLTIAPLSLSMFAIALLAGRRSGRRRPATLVAAGFGLVVVGIAVLLPLVPRADSGWVLVAPLVVAGAGLGLLVSQLNNYTLSPVAEERVSEAAGVNSAAGSFGLSFGLAFAGAIMLAVLSGTFTAQAQASTVLPPAEKQQVAQVLETDAELMSNTKLTELLAGQPEAIQQEVVRINTESRPFALQIGLVVPLLAAALGFVNSLRMRRLPDPEPSGAAETTLG
ncbi:MFS transporter [Pseudonocardia sulfidoxydans NBRC 16205]|uniref:MFS transporter n=1 Tax=Pseudonocardia sulfidoxydans NBRC 16205 TaxID=1223511 RepID=A0A511DBX9_9PSEU|nr:MFS transporter [Pseudonocardia sulfidoxydans]GEL21174.1 MFS transporter [Pseudonocardia sulfidoxydans NBRC 16205]